jgi:hypothetical protein
MRRILITGLAACLLSAGPSVAGTSTPTKYVMWDLPGGGQTVRKANPGVEWTSNPWGYRYGRWGGGGEPWAGGAPGWSNGKEQASVATGSAGIDEMDELFKTHDRAYAQAAMKLDQAKDLRKQALKQSVKEAKKTLKDARRLEADAASLEKDADDDLGKGLDGLPNQKHKTWGWIYVSKAKDEGRPDSVLYLVKEKGKKDRYETMPFSEFARITAKKRFK